MNARLISWAVCLAFTTAWSVAATAELHERDEAIQILEASGVTGGLVVHLECGDGALTAALVAGDRFIVQGLDTNAEAVEKARTRFRARGLAERVSADRWDGERLPYIDNLVNLLVTEGPEVPTAEVMRVLAPGGVAYLKIDDRWTRQVKARPDTIDEWNHYLHDPQGTMVSQDEVVGLPRRLQWIGGPKWMRNHDFMASLSGMVSSGGRVYYIVDEGLRYHIYLPARWTLVARDAFNGTILWKRPIAEWFPHTWPFKSGPSYLPRRLVADGDRLYVTMGINAPLSVLDAATGKIIRTYEDTRGTEEVVLDRGVLYLLVDPAKGSFPYKHASENRGSERDRVNREFGWSKESPDRLLVAVSADEGKILWQHKDNIGSLTTALDAKKVYYFDGERIVAIDSGSGGKVWESEPAGNSVSPATGYAPRLIVGDGVIVLSTKSRRQGRLVGVCADTGKMLWQSEQLSSGHFSPEDLYLIDGVVWTVHTGKPQTQGTHFQAIDAKTGETRHDFVADNLEVFFMHQRCYPGRATERYIMTSGTGTEFLELGTEHCELNHWLRGACIYGLMPANGLLYKTPDSCACYYQSKLPHFCALAPPRENPSPKQRNRFEEGPDYAGQPRVLKSLTSSLQSSSWPTYRGNNARSGHSMHTVPSTVRQLWKAEFGGKLSTITAADGRLFVAEIDRRTVHALHADTGESIWSFMAGGRVDSPPSIWRGRTLFGSADGWVYCLNATNGELIWRFQAAPANDKLVSYGQIESVWPLSGSVLIRDGVAYCLAGRSMFVDGGMRLVRLDCVTGKMLSETVLDDKDPRTGKNLQTLMAGKAVPVANADLLSCDENFVYMAAQKFDFQGKRVDLDLVQGKEKIQTGQGRHLFCPTGLLDGDWFHRSFWIYGTNAGEGHGEYPVPRSHTPTGRIMVFDESKVYASISHNLGNNINPRTYYTVYSAYKDADVVSEPEIVGDNTGQSQKKKRKPNRPRTKASVRHLWDLEQPGLLPNAMVLAGENLFIAGPPDVADERNTYGFVYGADDEMHRQLARQEQAWLGKEGALIWAISADTGEHLSECKLPALPVWDGMIAAHGHLYCALGDGTVICLSGD